VPQRGTGIGIGARGLTCKGRTRSRFQLVQTFPSVNETEYLLPAHVTKLKKAYPRLFEKGTRLEVEFPPGSADILDKLCSGLDRLLGDLLAAHVQVIQVKKSSARFAFAIRGRGEANG
jgi:hypothetical protein